MSVLIRIMKAHDEPPHHRAASEHGVTLESLAEESPWRQNWVVPAIHCFDKYGILCCPWFREQIVVVEERWGPEVLQEFFRLVRRRKSQKKERHFRETDFPRTVPLSALCICWTICFNFPRKSRMRTTTYIRWGISYIAHKIPCKIQLIF